MITLKEYKEHDAYYTGITAKVIEDSLYGTTRLTSFLLEMPVASLGHLVRHRSFSFSIASNRSIRVRNIKKHCDFVPEWKTATKGMQPADFVKDENILQTLNDALNIHKEFAFDFTKLLEELNISKEIANRYLAPFQYVTALVSGTDFSNFFKLRDDKDTQQETQVLARNMRKALLESIPKNLDKGDWHLPFITEEERQKDLGKALLVSAARCARTSYTLPNQEKNSDFESDLALCTQLLDPPIHASPFEHVATPCSMRDIYGVVLPSDVSSFWYGNYSGWVQFRKLLENTNWPNGLNYLKYISDV